MVAQWNTDLISLLEVEDAKRAESISRSNAEGDARRFTCPAHIPVIQQMLVFSSDAGTVTLTYVPKIPVENLDKPMYYLQGYELVVLVPNFCNEKE